MKKHYLTHQYHYNKCVFENLQIHCNGKVCGSENIQNCEYYEI